MALKVGELFASFNLDTSGIDSAVSSAERSLSNLGKGLTLGGAAMTAAITAPVIGAFKDIYSKGSDFNSQMSKVFAIRGLDSTLEADIQSMDLLNKKALEMGSTTKFTASEAGQAFEYMAMAGWDTASMLGGIGPILNLAAAAGEDLGTTSDIVTDAMTAFGYTIDKVGGDTQKFTEMTTHFTDVLAATSSNANTNVSMLGESFKYVGSIAGSLGYSIEDTAVALGIMANSGIKSSQAGTSLRTIMTRLNGDIKISGKNLKEVTIKTANADGSMRDFSEIIADCRKAFAGLTESEKAQMAESLVGRNAMSGFLTLMNATDDEIASLTGAITNCSGATERMADMMLDNVGGSVTLFKSAVEGLEITLWELVKGPVKGLIDRATGIVDAFRNMDSATQMGALKLAGFAAALGPVMTASGTLLMALPKIVKGIAMLSSPLGLVSIGLVALGAASMDAGNLMGKNLEKMAKSAAANMKKVQKSLLFKNWVLASRGNKFLNSVKSAVEEAGPVFMDTLSAVLKTGLSALGSIMPKAAEVATTLVKTITDGIARNAPGMAKTLARALTRLATSVIGAVPDMLHAGMTLFSALIDAVGKVNWLDIGKQLNTAITDALKEIRKNFYTLVFGEEPTAEDLGDWGKLGAKITENIKAGIKTASQNGKNLLGGLVLGNDYDPGDTWTTVATKIWGKITSETDGWGAKASDLLKGLVLGKDYKADATWGDVANKIWTTIQTTFETLKADTKTLIGTIALGEGYTADSTWGDIGQAIWDKIKEKIQALKDSTKNIVGSIVLGENYTASTTWAKIGTAIWDKIKDKIKALKESTKNIVGNIVLGKEYTASTTWGKIGTAIWEKIKERIKTLKDNTKNIVGNIVLGQEYTASVTWNRIGTAIWEKIKEKIKSLKDNTKNIIGQITLGEAYTADTTWEKIGEAIWQKIKDKLASLGKTAKNLIGELTLGDDYDPGDSWMKIGAAVWEKAKAGFAAASAAAKNLIGDLALGNDYSADDSWRTVGTKIWAKIKSGLGNIGEKIKAQIGKFALGENYDPGASWETIGSAIWEKIKNGLGDVAGKLKGLVANLVFDAGDEASEEGYTADPSWAQIGQKLWEKVQEGIGTAKDFADAVFEKIKSINIDVASVVTTIENAGTFVTNLVKNMLAGKITWGTKITDFAKTIADKLADYGWTGLGNSLGKTVTNLIGAIVGAIPNAVNAAGEAVNVGLTLAGGLIDTLVAAFDSTELDTGAFGNIVNSLVSNIVDLLPKAFELGGKALTAGAHIAQKLMDTILVAVQGDADGNGKIDFGGAFVSIVTTMANGLVDTIGRLPELIEGALSVGAQLVNAIMTNISTALSDLKASGIAEKLGTAATELLKNLLQNVGGLKDNPEVATFMENLGQSIMDGMSSLGSIVGGFCGKLLAYLFSVDGLRDIYNAGTSIVQLILEGMAAGMTGILSFIGDLIDTVLIELGIVDPETREAARAAGKELSTVIQAGMESGLMNGGGFMQELMEWSLFRGGGSLQNGKLDQNMMIFLNGIIGDAAEKAGDSAEVFRDEFISGWLNTKILDESFWKMLFPEELGDKGEGDAFFDYLEEFMGEYDDVEAFLKDKADLTKFFPDDMDFWAGFLNAVKTGDMTELMKIMTAQATEMFGEIGQESADAAKEAGEEMAQEYHEKIVGTAEEVSEETTEIIDEMSHANKEATKGLAAAATADMGEVEKAAADVSDAAVQQYLLTMSFDNGYLIGEEFVLAMSSGMTDHTGDLQAAALAGGQAAYDSLNGSASYANGYTIGYNFGQGFVNGIADMVDSAARAAGNLGSAATDSLSGIIREGSPSKVTGESGKMFGLGFINNILALTEGAENAAETMGMSAARALEYTIRDIGNAAADQTDFPLKSGYTRSAEAYQAGNQDNPSVEQMADRIVEALNGIGLYFDGEAAGRILTPHISEEMAHGTTLRR